MNLPDDFLTHKSAWRAAIEQMRDTATNNADLSYWKHELQAFDRTHDEVIAAFKSAENNAYLRAVACWKVCEDIPTEILEQMSPGAFKRVIETVKGIHGAGWGIQAALEKKHEYGR